ncbi:Gibberellin-regulated protein 11 [Zostera marina]|uniref:Gibberellin-regulated protein 11 n=1 Tax=Zostera marina TaxID=29655 RepID=A0A0K9NIL0_ZOSMR|nr:Gibberellin-regulated protein 11 [Zostera marina]
MALKLAMAIFLVATFLLFTSEIPKAYTSSIAEVPSAAPPEAGTGETPKIKYVDVAECPSLCLVRCAKHSRPNHCHRACGTCCFRCKCVPPGTYGNREMCGQCYTDMTTHHNRTKCP